jgi:predicted PurR-regulated permease PerM
VVRVEFSPRHVVYGVGVLLLAYLLYLLRDTVVLVAIAVMLMAALHPLVQLATRHGLAHGAAVAVVMLGLVLVPLAVLVALSPLIISEVQGFAHNIPTLQQHIDDLLRNVGLASQVNSALAKVDLQDRLGNLAVISAAPTLTFFTDVFEVIVIAGYLLADSHRLQLVLHQFVPRRSERHIEPLLIGMERVVGGYIRGQLLTSGLFGVFGFVLCLGLGVSYPLLLGIVAAVGDVIPLFGIQLAMLVTALVALTNSTWQAIAVIAGYIVYGQLESHILVPRIYARTVNLSPLMVILATIIGAKLYGIVGILIGIPIVGVLKVVFDYIVAERVQGQAGATQQMVHETTDPLGREQAVAEDEHGEAGAEAAAAAGIPKPSFSPFESIPVDVDPERLPKSPAP